MNLGNLLFLLPQELKKKIREIEKLSYKLNAVETAVIFNKVCLKEGLYPKYTNVRLHDPNARTAPATIVFRRQLVHRQLEEKKKEKIEAHDHLQRLHQEWDALGEHPNREEIRRKIQELKDQDYSNRERTILRKLVRCNGGHLRIPQKEGTSYVNLTDYIPTAAEHSLLQMGLNCHILEKPKPGAKRIEIEVLLDSIFALEDRGKLRISDDLQPLLLAEALRDEGNYRSNLMTSEMRNAAKALREKENIVIRRADKTAAFVLIRKEDYLTKLDDILNDPSKFRRINRNPIDDIKREANRIIESINAVVDATHLPKISGDYDVGYIYGNVKTHKRNNPLRPIISQCPTPTYHLAKTLNKILSPYVPTEYCLSSSAEFLARLRGAPSSGLIASLDVESLFTNVPVDETISMMMDRIYRDNTTPNLDIPEQALRRLLEICTREAPFVDQRGRLWRQIDGIAMGSPLGVLFANFYMGIVEQKVFSRIPRPNLYVRYVDDTFVNVADEDELERLRNTFEEESVLHFTCEKSVENSLPFLDVRVTKSSEGFKTTVYRKPTDLGLCLNGDSECPEKYLTSVISSYVGRALSHCSTWQATHEEIDHASQTLVNNGYSNEIIQKVTRKVIEKWYRQEENAPRERDNTIRLYYRSYMHKNYKKDEATLKNIIRAHVAPTEEDSKVDLVIYYKNKRTSQLLMKNSPSSGQDLLKKRGVVYQLMCPASGCPQSYIGMTTLRLSKRLSVHLQEGAVFQHFNSEHGALRRQHLLQNVKVLDGDTNQRRLRYKEALHILQMKPSLNVTQETLLLPTTIRRQARRPAHNALASDPSLSPRRPMSNPPVRENPRAPRGDEEAAARPRRSARIRQILSNQSTL